MSGTRDWDAGTYHRVSDVHMEWAEQVLGRLHLSGDETVLDAGCGNGRWAIGLAELHGEFATVLETQDILKLL